MKILFNPKTISRLTSNIKINSKQKKASDEWLKLLHSGTLKEKENYFNFALFVLKDVLGYTIKHDLKHEEGNVEFTFHYPNGEKMLVIEVKDSDTDLFKPQTKGKTRESPVQQLWRYLSKEAIPYGVATNYREFILFDYSKGYSKYYKFNFIDIEKDTNKLKEFIAVFSKNNVESGYLEKIHKESLIEEREFTKEFYKLYHETRLMLIKEYSEDVSKDAAIHFAQLILNRLMFIFFAEDKELLDKRYFVEKILQVLKAGIIDNHSSFVSSKIASVFKELDKETPKQIRGFNGELFRAPFPQKIFFKDLRPRKFFKEILQDFKLDKGLDLFPSEKEIISKYKDKLNPIVKNFLLMGSFDFNTEVNVNILGHIFEQSITDLEKIHEKRDERRKIQGVFYTPEYVTDYICRNTIFPYLSKKISKDVRSLIIEHSKNINELETKIKNIKIIDPACGSGAFLLKAVDILVEIIKEIQMFKENKGDYLAIKKGRKRKKELNQFTLNKWNEEEEARDIILNSIYGVDINEESVEITKLSLFLKIARKNKKLVDLSNNVKHGDSLLSDENQTKQPFNWGEQFPFKFDIVIGNPPYVRQERFTDIKPYLEENYQIYNGVADLYTYFYERGISILKEGGHLGFISSNKFMKAKYGTGLRKLLKNVKLEYMLNFFELPVFEDASTEPIIVILKNENKPNKKIKVALFDTLEFLDFNKYLKSKSITVNQENLSDDGWNLSGTENIKILDKIKKNTVLLGEFISKQCFSGIKTGANFAFVINQEVYDELVKKDSSSRDIVKPLIDGVEMGKYTYNWTNLYLVVTKRGTTIDRYPAVRDYLAQFKNKLANRSDIKGKGKWFELRRCAYYDNFTEEKIVYIHTAKNHKFALDKIGKFIINNCYFIVSSSRYLLAYLNSKLFKFYKINTFVAFGDAKSKGRCKLDYNKMVKVPIKQISEKQEKVFKEKVNKIIELKNEINNLIKILKKRIKTNYIVEKFSKKLTKFYDLDFNEFFNELKKLSSKRFSLVEQDELEEYFVDYKTKITEIQKEVNSLDNELNDMIYTVYNLTNEERRIVEENIASTN